MRQKYYHYSLWEDFKNGMYDEDKEGRKERIEIAIKCLTDHDICYQQMTRVVNEWKYATEQNLTNPSMNHRAFLGQSACSIYGNVHEDETREAWGYMTQQQRYDANKIADRVFLEWQQKYERESEDCYQLSLFDFGRTT